RRPSGRNEGSGGAHRHYSRSRSAVAARDSDRVATPRGVRFPFSRSSVQTSLNPSTVVPLDHDRVDVDDQVAKKKPSRERGPAGEQRVKHGRYRYQHPHEMSLLAPTRPHVECLKATAVRNDLIVRKKVADVPEHLIPIWHPPLEPTHPPPFVKAAR